MICVEDTYYDNAFQIKKWNEYLGI